MANQNSTGVGKIPSRGPKEIERQIAFDVDTNTGWPQPTAPKKSDAAEVGPPQGGYGLAGTPTAQGPSQLLNLKKATQPHPVFQVLR
jgi:hypothetical protein